MSNGAEMKKVVIEYSILEELVHAAELLIHDREDAGEPIPEKTKSAMLTADKVLQENSPYSD